MVCVVDEGHALCIVRDFTGISSEVKITLQVPGTMLVREFVREVASRFNYEPDSFELVLQHSTNGGEQIILTEGNEETLEAAGLNTESGSRNAFLLSGLGGTIQPRLKTSPTAGDEELSLGASASPTASSGEYPSIAPPPPPPPPVLSTTSEYPYTAGLIKQDTGYVGLVNQAMTCYLNSLLQALFMTPEFRNALYKWKFDSNLHEPAKSIPYQLQRLFLNLQTSTKNAVETTELTRSFGWDSSEAWQQHDIQELCRVMFDALEQVFKETEQADLIDRLYQGKMIDYVKCLECGREKSREDTFLDIPLPVRPFGSSVAYGSVEEALRAFVQPETLEGNNQYHCENCAKKCDAHKGLKFTKFPYLLTLHLKRFDFDYNTMYRIKLNDKVVFPEILDLNSFIPQEKEEGSEGFPEELTTGKCDDSSTTDSGSALDDESCQGATELPQSSTDNAQEDDEGIDVSGGNGATNHHENEKNRRHTLQKGPYIYELFSIMIHSGSASGGHYYAYIKDFSNGEWFCFNDQTVRRITNDDIAKTYGGGSVRGYYSGAYSSSTNAYMLMYRQIDKDQNCQSFTIEQFPLHIQEMYKQMQEREETDRMMKERQQDMCKLKVFYRHPTFSFIIESKIYCHNDTTLKEATEQAYKSLNMKGVVPLDQCRLVNYNSLHDTIEVSFDGKEDEPISEILSGLRSACKNDFMMEIKPEGGQFQNYQLGGAVTKVYVVDIEKEEIEGPSLVICGSMSQTVLQLKEKLGAHLSLDPSTLNVVLEKNGKDDKEHQMLEDNNCTLKQAGFYPSNKVFVCAGSYDPDPEKPFITSKFSKLIDRFDHIITLHFSLPDIDPEVLSRLSIPPLNNTQTTTNSTTSTKQTDTAVDKGSTNSNGEASGGSRGLLLPLLLSGSGVGGNGNGVGSGNGDDEASGTTAAGGQSDQSASEDSSLTDSDRTLIGDVPDECHSDGDQPQPTKNVILAEDLDNEENWDEDESHTHLSPHRHFYFKAVPYNEYNRKMVKVQVDRRMILGALKTALAPYVGVPSNYFKIYRVSGSQEYECSRLRESLSAYKNEEYLAIKLGRALRVGEYRVRVYQLLPDSPQPIKYLCDWVVAKGVTVGETKKEILEEISTKCGIKIPFDRCRLRKKNWKNPVKVLLDSQVWVDDIPVFSSWDIFLQELPGPEIITSTNQLLLFARRWHPSTLTLDKFEEVLLDGVTVKELKEKLSERSGIPVENVEIAKGIGFFPCDVSVLGIQSDVDWNLNTDTLDGWPLQISEDGQVIFYRDSREELKNLTSEERSELTSKENARLNGHNSTVSLYSPRKERPLKIYLDSTPRRPRTVVEPDID